MPRNLGHGIPGNLGTYAAETHSAHDGVDATRTGEETMKVRIGQIKRLLFVEDGHEMSVHYSTRGDPFRDGVEFVFDKSGGSPVWVLLDRMEIALLRDKLNEFLSAKD
jgi:hypothetical protein